MVGQGGPLQAALTSKELRELSRLRGCQPQLCREDFNAIGRLVDSKHKTECLYGLQPHALCCVYINNIILMDWYMHFTLYGLPSTVSIIHS